MDLSFEDLTLIEQFIAMLWFMAMLGLVIVVDKIRNKGP